MTDATDRSQVDWISDCIDADSKLAAQFEQICRALDEGHLTLAEVGGFSREQLDAAFTCACHYVNTQEPKKGLSIIGTLLVLDNNRADYFLTGAIALHQLKRYDAADAYYETANRLAPDDPVTLMYYGEARVLGGHVDSGRELLERGIALAGDSGQLKPFVKRANRVLSLTT